MGDKKTFLIIQIIFIVVLPVVFGSLLFITPFSGDVNLIDEGQFMAWANRMIHGELMYRDIYITYGPLLVWPLYFLFDFFGPSAFLTRTYFVVASQILSICIVALLINNLKVAKATKLLMILGVILLPGMNIRMGVAYLAIFFLIKAFNSKNLIWDFLLGCSCVVAFLTSPETGVFCFALFVFYSLYGLLSKNLFFAAKKIGYSISGTIISVLLFVVWAGSEGWLKDYLYVTKDVFDSFSGVNLPNGQKFPNPALLFQESLTLNNLLKYAVSQSMLLYWQALFYLAIFVYIAIRLTLRKFTSSDRIIFLINLYAFFLYATLIGKHGGYYLTFSPIVIFSFYFIDKLIFKFKSSKNLIEKILAVTFVIFLALFLTRLALIFRPHFSKVKQVLNITFQANYINRLGKLSVSENQKRYILTYQEFINKNTQEDDKIFILTNEAGIYMLIDRTNPTRYDLPYVAATIDKRYEMLSDLQKEKPKFIFDDTNAWEIDGISNRKRLPEVYEFIKKNYRKDSNLGSVVVYKIK